MELKRKLLCSHLPQSYAGTFFIALSRNCESTIPRSGEKGERVNCFTVSIDKAGDPYLMVLEIHVFLDQADGKSQPLDADALVKGINIERLLGSIV